eukprot:m.69912 g.69912  ORF g.69912 m.69912 type:complete len:495 (+) comp18448_c0_seq1:187-1671(+)
MASAMEMMLLFGLAAVVWSAPGQYGDANPYNKPPPGGVDPDFDCAWRKAALLFAKKIQPDSKQMSLVFDSLQLSACGESRPEERLNDINHDLTLPLSGHVVYIAPAGSDNAAGTASAPLATIHAGVDKLRSLGGAGNTVVLRAGVYRFASTLEIGPMDVNLTIQAYPGEMPWISGAAEITPAWTAVPPDPSKPITWQIFNNSNNVMAMNCGKNDGSFCPPAKVLGKPMSADACEALCKADGECTVWTWHDANQGVWSYECVTRTDGLWAPTEEVGHMSGRRIGPVGTAYVADVSTAGVDDINSLRVDGARATRARYPNVRSVETDIFPTGWITNSHNITWGPPTLAPKPEINIEISDPSRAFCMNEFQNFELGVKGCCNNFVPQEGYVLGISFMTCFSAMSLLIFITQGAFWEQAYSNRSMLSPNAGIGVAIRLLVVELSRIAFHLDSKCLSTCCQMHRTGTRPVLLCKRFVPVTGRRGCLKSIRLGPLMNPRH